MYKKNTNYKAEQQIMKQHDSYSLLNFKMRHKKCTKQDIS